MHDAFGRRITYLRLSVTDRCNLRCRYCMGEDVEMMPRKDLLTLEEMERLCAAFIRLSVRRIRLTGGEPLVRRGIVDLVARLSGQVAAGRLDEVTLTTNGTRLGPLAAPLRSAGLMRVNVSLDTLSPEIYSNITRGGALGRVLEGIEAAKQAGLAVKINAVMMKGVNESGVDALVSWCGQEGFDLVLIETMPLGDVGIDRARQYVPIDRIRRRLERRWTLIASDYRSSGPARYVTVAETGGRLGFIAATTHNFCTGCDRVRVTATGILHPCLGHDWGVDLLGPLRSGESDQALEAAILFSLSEKPRGHGFSSDSAAVSVPRRGMSVTGG